MHGVTFIDAGFVGDITLEIIWFAALNTSLPVGKRFVHLSFEQLCTPSEPYAGKYQDQRGITEAILDAEELAEAEKIHCDTSAVQISDILKKWRAHDEQVRMETLLEVAVELKKWTPAPTENPWEVLQTVCKWLRSQAAQPESAKPHPVVEEAQEWIAERQRKHEDKP